MHKTEIIMTALPERVPVRAILGNCCGSVFILIRKREYEVELGCHDLKARTFHHWGKDGLSNAVAIQAMRWCLYLLPPS